MPSPDDLFSAQERLEGQLYVTPVLRNAQLDARAGAELWIKAENLQVAGAFKARGALNNLAQLSAEERASGLITYSSGNHAQAVAWAARHYGCKATIFMPTDAPAVKVEAVEALGATIVAVGTTSLERQAAARSFAASEGGVIIEPFDHPHTIVGQGTASLELQQEVAARSGGALQTLFVPVGGGGLVAGACLAFAGSETRVIGVEPESCNSMQRSLAAGKVVAVEPGDTIADGLKPTRVGELNFAICKEHLHEVVTVSDEELEQAMVSLLMHAKVLVEPSGAAALAAALRCAAAGTRVGVILSGGNVARERVLDLLGRYQA